MAVARYRVEMQWTGSHEVDGCGFPDMRSVAFPDGGARRAQR